ncbi:amino acid decarboxylase [Streptomyces sp. B-S-A8]|uniref:Amino acid decarboxylase n=1 Tax=Streptomyces solicavernae TaxID=3043614 RepID=A0ABT6RTM0_9ACTN|nr:amino acid decarboxylase [Streptomyces sp. B-S-A8]MDI3387782.1 amino acid decarboxylase [Streptomyces sp. B-S-A8]
MNTRSTALPRPAQRPTGHASAAAPAPAPVSVPEPASSTAAPPPTGPQPHAPYAEALLAHAGRDWLRLNVPGHAADASRFASLAQLFGPGALALDFPPLLDGLDLGAASPLARAQELAAEAWGARRTWFLTNGASQANQIASLVTPALGDTLVVQRSVHSSVIDGLVLSGLDAVFVQPSIDAEQGIAHGIGPEALAEALAQALAAASRPAAAYVVSPSYFGAVADIRALADVAHGAGVPLIVDEAWGAHFGFHPDLPGNALSQGADLVTSSTHKLGGSLTQSAMLHLADGPYADRLEPLIDRAHRMVQSTSASALLLASLDLARAQLACGTAELEASIEAADRIRRTIRRLGRFRLVSDTFDRYDDITGADPLRIAIDTRHGHISGHEARRLLYRDHQIMVEVATDAAVVAVIGAGSQPDTERFVEALHCLPSPLSDAGHQPLQRLPAPGPARLTTREAFHHPARLLPAAEAIGHISADTLAAYPPGIPNLLPGEVITPEVVDFLRYTANTPHGHIRGAHDPLVTHLRVIDSGTH